MSSPTDQLFAGRYRLERRLGVGGMSTVQLAMDTRLERYVAVKLLAEHLAQDAGFVARFQREALAAARLVHPNVVQVFDFGTEEVSHRQFIVMEWVDGPSCAELLRDHGRLPPPETVEILTQACRALEYAHRNGIVHRDVKPGNLLRNDDGLVKLADFGIAKAAEDSDITKVGSVVGTAAYLSPEQSRGAPAGPASDLYALGVVAYQLLSGRLPYLGASLTELARQQEAGPPDRLERVEPDVPPVLARVVERALAPRPESRFASAVEMEHALRAALQGQAPAPPSDATIRLPGSDVDATRPLADDTAATRALPPQPRRAAQAQRPPSRQHRAAEARRLEPISSVAPAPSRAGRRAEAAPARARPPRRRRRPGRIILLLLLVALMVSAGIAGYEAVQDATTKSVQIRDDVQGSLESAIDDLKGVISDNTQ
jgi:serine/threonine-protein kinase